MERWRGGGVSLKNQIFIKRKKFFRDLLKFRPTIRHTIHQAIRHTIHQAIRNTIRHVYAWVMMAFFLFHSFSLFLLLKSSRFKIFHLNFI